MQEARSCALGLVVGSIAGFWARGPASGVVCLVAACPVATCHCHCSAGLADAIQLLLLVSCFFLAGCWRLTVLASSRCWVQGGGQRVSGGSLSQPLELDFSADSSAGSPLVATSVASAAQAQVALVLARRKNGATR